MICTILNIYYNLIQSGPGGSITDMKFDQNERNILYRTSIDSTVSRIDFEHSGNSLTYMNHDSYT